MPGEAGNHSESCFLRLPQCSQHHAACEEALSHAACEEALMVAWVAVNLTTARPAADPPVRCGDETHPTNHTVIIPFHDLHLRPQVYPWSPN